MTEKEEVMISTRIGRVCYLLLAGLLVVGAFVYLRVQRVEAADAVPVLNPREAAEIYRERIDATQKLLAEDRLDL